MTVAKISGAKGGGSSFKQTPDNLRSTDTFEGVLGLAIGPLKGPKNGQKSIKLDGTALENETGESNFGSDFVATIGNGDPAAFPQPVQLKLGSGATPSIINLPLVNTNTSGPGTWVTRTLTNTGADFIDLRFIVQQLFRQDKKGIYDHTLTIEVQMKPTNKTTWVNPTIGTVTGSYSQSGQNVAGAFGSVLRALYPKSFYDGGGNWSNNQSNFPISGKTTSPTAYELRVNVPNEGIYANVQWDVRVRLLEKDSVDADPNFEKRQVSWESMAAVYSTIMGTHEDWRGLAWMQIYGKASDQLTGVPEITGEWETKIVSVPPATVYNPDTRQYTGALWDGSWTKAYTNDPAWVINDAISDSLSGLSLIASGSYLNKWDALEASKWCSQLVSDGDGGLQPRYSINIAISEPMKAEEFIRYLAGAVGGLAWDEGDGQWRLKIDKPDTAVDIFTLTNIEGEFVYGNTDVDTRFNDITGTFKNADMDYRQDRVRLFDNPSIAAIGRKPTNIVLVGCTNRQEARRRVKLRLRAAVNERRIVNFTTNRRGRNIQQLDLILVADGDLGNQDQRTDGRIISIAADRKSIVVRDPLYVATGVSYNVRFASPNAAYSPDSSTQPTSADWKKPTTVQSYAVTNTSGQRGNVTTVYFGSALPADIDLNAVVALEAVGLVTLPKLYRVTNVVYEEDGEKISISALEVDVGKWDAADAVSNEDAVFQNLIGDVPVPQLPLSGNVLTLTKTPAAQGANTVLEANWVRPSGAFINGFKVSYRINGGAWKVPVERSQESTFELVNPVYGEYEFEVRTLDRRGLVSEPLYSSLTIDQTLIDATQIKYVSPISGLPTVPINDLMPAEPGADITGTHTSNDTANVAGRPSATVLAGIDAALAAIDVTAPGVPTGLAVTSNVTQDPVTGEPIVKLVATCNSVVVSDLAGYDFAIQQGSGSFIEFRVISPRYELLVPANTGFNVKVRSVDTSGNASVYTSVVSHTTARDTVAPATPTSLTATAAFTSAFLSCTAPADLDLDVIELWQNTTNNSGTATKVGYISVYPGQVASFTRTGLATNTAYFYWVKAVDTSGNASAFSAVATTTTTRIQASDLTTNLAGIENVGALPSTGNFQGRMVFLNTDGQLYRWNSATTTGTTFWTATVPTTGLTGMISPAQTAIGLGTSANLLLNGGAETGDTSAWAFGQYNTGTSTLTAVATTPNTGAYAFRLTKTAITGTSADMVSRAIPVQPGKQYNIKLAAKGDTATAVGFYIYVYFGNSINTATGFLTSYPSTLFPSNGSNSPIGTSWTPFDFTVTAPAGYSYMAVSIFSYTTGGPLNLYVDDVGVYEQITTNSLADSAISLAKMGVNSVDTTKLVDLSITTAKLNDGAVSLAKMGSNSVDTSKLVDLSITTVKLNDAAVSLAKLATNSVDTSKLLDNIITTAKLVDAAVSTIKIQDGALSLAKFATGLTPVERVAVLPSTANFQGRVVMLTTDGKLYRWTDTSTTGTTFWSKATDGADITANSIVSNSIAVGTIQGDRIGANQISASKLFIGDNRNLIPDPMTQDIASWTKANSGNGALALSSASAATWGSNLVLTIGTQTSGTTDVYSSKFPVTPGDKLYAGANVAVYSGTVSETTPMYIVYYFNPTDSAGNFTTFSVISTVITPTATVTPWAAEVTVPAGVAYAALLMRRNSGTSVGLVGFGAPFAYRKSTGVLIVDGAITTNHMTANTINGDRIQTNTLNANKIVSNSITSAQILAGTITATEIASGAITTVKLAAGAVTANEIGAGAITTVKLAAGAVTANEIASGAITTVKLAAGSVTTNELGANSVTTAKLVAGAVTATEIASGAITTIKLAAEAVTTNGLAAGAVTAVKIAALTITGSLIQANTITTDKLVVAPGNLIANSDFATGDFTNYQPENSAGQQFVRLATFSGVPTGAPTKYVATGEGTIGGSGMFTGAKAYNAAGAEKDGFIVTPGEEYQVKIDAATTSTASGAAIRVLAYFYKADGTINTNIISVPSTTLTSTWTTFAGSFVAPAGAMRCWLYINIFNNANGFITAWTNLRVTQKASAALIVDGSITAVKIQAASITGDRMVANTITATQIAVGTITTNLIQAGAITTALLAAGSITATKLAIGDNRNLVADPQAADINSWIQFTTASAFTTQTVTGSTWGASKAFVLATNNSISPNIASQKFPVTPGEKYLLGGTFGNISGTVSEPSYLIIYWYNDQTTTTWSPLTYDLGSPFTTTTTPTLVQREVTAPAGAAYAAFVWQRNGGTSTGLVGMTNPFVYRKAGGTLIQDGAITTNHITVGTLNGDRIQVGTLTAAALTAGTALAGSITVSGTALSTIQTQASDPAARINAFTTYVDPGRILVSGSTYLSDWRQGGDLTKIAGGQISANTVLANSVQVGLRGIQFEGLEFQHNWNGSAVTTSALAWTAGTISYVNDSNSPTSASISAGTVTWSSGTLYIYWVKGASTLSNTTSLATALGVNNVLIAAYRGTTDLNVTYGRTVIDGSKISTGTVGADKITSGTIFTQQLYLGGTTFVLDGANGGAGKGALLVKNAALTVNLISLGWLDGSTVGFQLKNNSGQVLLDNTFDPNAIIADTLTGGTSNLVVEADYQGVVISGQLPKTVSFDRVRGSTNVTSTTTWAVTTSPGVTASINSSGVLSVTAMSGDSASLTINSTYSGVVKQWPINLQKHKAAAPPPAATSVSTTKIYAPTSTSYSGSQTPVLSVTAGAAGQVVLSTDISFTVAYSSGSGFYAGLIGKWQWRAVGGSWADVAAEQYEDTQYYQPPNNGYQQYYYDVDDPSGPGYINVDMTKSGLTVGTVYEFQLLLRRAVNYSYYPYGSAYAQGQ